jgi:hypothetical protein
MQEAVVAVVTKIPLQQVVLAVVVQAQEAIIQLLQFQGLVVLAEAVVAVVDIQVEPLADQV